MKHRARGHGPAAYLDSRMDVGRVLVLLRRAECMRRGGHVLHRAALLLLLLLLLRTRADVDPPRLYGE